MVLRSSIRRDDSQLARCYEATRKNGWVGFWVPVKRGQESFSTVARDRSTSLGKQSFQRLVGEEPEIAFLSPQQSPDMRKVSFPSARRRRFRRSPFGRGSYAAGGARSLYVVGRGGREAEGGGLLNRYVGQNL